MFQSLLNWVFGCSHRRTTFPLSPPRKVSGFGAAPVTRHTTYVTCLDCGKEFDYDWAEMRLGEPVKTRVPSPAESYSTVNR